MIPVTLADGAIHTIEIDAGKKLLINPKFKKYDLLFTSNRPTITNWYIQYALINIHNTLMLLNKKGLKIL